MRCIIVPGNGNCDISLYSPLKKELEKVGIEVIAEQMPDAELARKEHWLPWIKKKAKGADDLLLFGHSSGSVAILRYLESNPALGAILLTPYHTDLGMATEKASHYFDSQWRWDAIRKNVRWLILISSTDDPFIPIDEARFVRDKLKAHYFEYHDKGHFTDRTLRMSEFPDVVRLLQKKLLLKMIGKKFLI